MYLARGEIAPIETVDHRGAIVPVASAHGLGAERGCRRQPHQEGKRSQSRGAHQVEQPDDTAGVSTRTATAISPDHQPHLWFGKVHV